MKKGTKVKTLQSSRGPRVELRRCCRVLTDNHRNLGSLLEAVQALEGESEGSAASAVLVDDDAATSVLSPEAFSPHETHYCLVGSGIGLVVFVRALRGLISLSLGGCCLLIWRCARIGF